MSAGHKGDDALKWPVPKLFAWADLAGKQRARERLEEASDTRNAHHADKNDWKTFVKQLLPEKWMKRNG